jgi:hypothetical protein
VTRYKNNKPSILGLSFKASTEGAPGDLIVVKPGQVFEADPASIPPVYFTQRWISETTEPLTETEDGGPMGVTDMQAALSGAYGEAAREAGLRAAATGYTPPVEPPTEPVEPPPVRSTPGERTPGTPDPSRPGEKHDPARDKPGEKPGERDARHK